MRSIKSRLTTTRFGNSLLELARWRSIRSLSSHNPEVACAVANGIIADRLITSLTPPGGVFLDVGAHIGSIIAQVRRRDETTHIFAVEADPIKAQALVARFPSCTIFDVAVSDYSGTSQFFVNAALPGYSSIVPDHASGNDRKIEIRIARLDDLLPETRVDVIKMDIEGAELGALRGADRLLDHGRPVIMFESVGTGENALGYSSDQIWDLLTDRDFAIFNPDRLAHDAAPLSKDAFLDSHQYPFRSHDYFAVPIENRPAVRDRARRILGVNAAG